jgi:hypothetical protein
MQALQEYFERHEEQAFIAKVSDCFSDHLRQDLPERPGLITPK